MNETKYIPVWHITINKVRYSPAAPGEAETLIEGLSKEEAEKLLKKGAIKKLVIKTGKPAKDNKSEDITSAEQPPDGKSIDEMNFSELNFIATELGITVRVGTSTETLRELVRTAQQGQS